jgi:TIGR03009 family protein
MTRLVIGLSFLLSLLEAAPLLAQQPAQQPARQPVRQPVRPVGGQAAPRGPAGPQAEIGPPAQAAPAGTVAKITPLGQPSGVQQPAWIPLNQEHEAWVNQVLQFWEARSNKIKALSCEFVRWEYDPVNGPADPETAKTIATGVIKYAQPDKGKFQVTSLALYAGPPDAPGGKPKYETQDASFAEHWISDGKRVFQLDARNKRVVETELPPEMQGKAIADGPLPFLFGARAETIRARYWVRGLPQSGGGKYWLEAVPKAISDARNFKAVTIVLDEKSYLPELLEVLAPNFDAKTNPARSTYQFKKHDVVDDKLNPAELLGKLNPFKTAFYAPTKPRDWEWIVEKADGTVRAGRGAAGALEATQKPQPPRNLAVPR